METATRKSKFALGRLVATPAALAEIPRPEIFAALARHMTGDWGDCSPEDAAENDLSLEEGDRLLSVYHYQETKYWIITEGDRSATTVLLPEDY